MHVEGRPLVGIAGRPEAVGVEGMAQPSAAPLRDRLYLDLVLAGARRRAVREQIVAFGRRLDSRRHVVEALLDVGAVLGRVGAGAADLRELPAVNLLADPDDVGL